MKINGLQAEIENEGEYVRGRPSILNKHEKRFIQRCYKKGIRATEILKAISKKNKKANINNIYAYASLSGFSRKININGKADSNI